MANEQSKKLSYLLRHKPEAAGLKLDKEGWCRVDDLVTLAGFDITEIFQIVAEDEKQRYALSPDSRHIRANQGHSVSGVDIKFKQVIPPVSLWHGADTRALPQIMKEGLLPMNRHYVHLSVDEETARVVGGRRKNFTVLLIDTKQMVSEGQKFFISDNGVYLVEHVHPKNIKAKA